MWKLLQNPSRAVVIFSLTGADKHLADVNNSVINPCRTTAILTLRCNSKSCTYVISKLNVFSLFLDRKRNLKVLHKGN